MTEKIPKILPKEINDKYSIKNNTFVRIAKSDPKDKIEVEVGDIKQPDFLPQMKLKRWDNEVNFSIRLKDTEYEKAGISTLKDKIIWDRSNTKIEFYDFVEGEGGYKVVWYLKEKPATNKIEFTIQSKGLDFFYQPELTQKEIDEGCVRPENVVGSYAVYHQTKGRMNDINGKEYKCGKFCHIYRPHIIDAKGKETWGILHIENGIYSVEIPQEFLDRAVYPIKSNDTFGYESIGGTWQSTYNRISGTYFMGAAGTATKLTAYSSGFDSWSKAAIYKQSDNSFVVGSSEIDSAITQWNDYTIANTAIIAQNYWLVLWSSRYGTGGTTTIKYDTPEPAENEGGYDNETYGNWPTLSPISENRKYSIYGTYTPTLSQKSVSDSGQGVDSGIIDRGVDKIIVDKPKSVQDSGSGTGLLNILAKLAVLSDSGAGSETIETLVRLALTDTGTGSEALSILSKIIQQDSGVGSEVLLVLKKILLLETGQGAESWMIDRGFEKITVEKGIIKSVQDTGSGSEVLNILSQIAITDSAAGVEAINIIAKIALSDSGLGTDAIEILRQIVISDSGVAAEALEILRKIAISDSGTATEALTILVQLAVSEAGAGTEEISIVGIRKFVEDTGVGTDALNVLTAIAVGDTGIGSEIIGIAKQMVITDSGQGTEAIQILVQLALTDSGTGTEAIQTIVSLAVQDLGVGIEVLDILRGIIIFDSGSAVEALKIVSTIAVADSGVGSDLAKILLKHTLVLETGTGAEAISILNKILIQEGSVGQDIAQIIASVNISEVGIGNDIVLVLVKLLVQDSGAGVDTIQKVDQILVQDTGVGAGIASILAKVSVLDIGIGVDKVHLRGQWKAITKTTGAWSKTPRKTGAWGKKARQTGDWDKISRDETL